MIKRILVFLGVFSAMILLAYVGLDFVLRTAPQKSLLFLEENPIWFYLIIGSFWLSIILVSVNNALIFSRKARRTNIRGGI